MSKSEHKIVQDLVGSGLYQSEDQFQGNIEQWDKSLDGLERYRQDMVGHLSSYTVDWVIITSAKFCDFVDLRPNRAI